MARNTSSRVITIFTGRLRLPRQHERQRLEVDRDLAAEAAADLARRSPSDVRRIDAENAGAWRRARRSVPGCVVQITARPSSPPARHTGMRLDVALMHRSACGTRARPRRRPRRTPRRRRRAAAPCAPRHWSARRLDRRPASLVTRSSCRIGASGASAWSTVDHRRQHLVVDARSASAAARAAERGRGDGGDGVAVIQHLVVRASRLSPMSCRSSAPSPIAELGVVSGMSWPVTTALTPGIAWPPRWCR